jgi:hypothetical protein
MNEVMAEAPEDQFSESPSTTSPNDDHVRLLGTRELDQRLRPAGDQLRPERDTCSGQRPAPPLFEQLACVLAPFLPRDVPRLCWDRPRDEREPSSKAGLSIACAATTSAPVARARRTDHTTAGMASSDPSTPTTIRRIGSGWPPFMVRSPRPIPARPRAERRRRVRHGRDRASGPERTPSGCRRRTRACRVRGRQAR